jgi:hypothetical protein
MMKRLLSSVFRGNRPSPKAVLRLGRTSQSKRLALSNPSSDGDDSRKPEVIQVLDCAVRQTAASFSNPGV